MMDALQTDLLCAVNDYLSERVGLFFGELRFADLERGLLSTADELDFSGVSQCIEQLLSNSFSKVQTQILIRNLTVGETYFFRDPSVFLCLEEKFLPELRRRRASQKYLRIWSAGCSTGEEPYSIAMSISRAIPDWQQWNIGLLATDINTRSLEKARKGRYSPWSFRTMPEDFLPAFFETPPVSGQYLLKEALRKMVSFDYLNLAEDRYPSAARNTGDLDIIFCRNVLIYFTLQKCREIADKLSKCLVPGGILVTSASDAARLINAVPDNMVRLNATTFARVVPG